jgi:hypothetical protein
MSKKKNILSIDLVNEGIEILCNGDPCDIIVAIAETMNNSKEFKAMMQAATILCDSGDLKKISESINYVDYNNPLGNA